jgi:hypothetical protein
MLKVLEYINFVSERIFRLLFAKRPRRFRYRGVRGLDGDI